MNIGVAVFKQNMYIHRIVLSMYSLRFSYTFNVFHVILLVIAINLIIIKDIKIKVILSLEHLSVKVN